MTTYQSFTKGLTTLTNWPPPQRPAELTEQRLIQAILEGEFKPGSTLPGERDLAQQLGVTRPTLREALQRLARDGWLTIQQGKPTRVNDFWWEGNLNVLGAIVRYSQQIPDQFIPNLLAVRLALAPAYTAAAVTGAPQAVLSQLEPCLALTEQSDAGAFANTDWSLHIALIRASGNPIYMLIFNGFSEFYVAMAQNYFENPAARRASCAFYTALHQAATNHDPAAAAAAAQHAMENSISLWQNKSR